MNVLADDKKASVRILASLGPNCDSQITGLVHFPKLELLKNVFVLQSSRPVRNGYAGNGMWASELDHGSMVESSLVGWITFSLHYVDGCASVNVILFYFQFMMIVRRRGGIEKEGKWKGGQGEEEGSCRIVWIIRMFPVPYLAHSMYPHGLTGKLRYLPFDQAISLPRHTNQCKSQHYYWWCTDDVVLPFLYFLTQSTVYYTV